jgi:hypothetical protein
MFYFQDRLHNLKLDQQWIFFILLHIYDIVKVDFSELQASDDLLASSTRRLMPMRNSESQDGASLRIQLLNLTPLMPSGTVVLNRIATIGIGNKITPHNN